MGSSASRARRELRIGAGVTRRVDEPARQVSASASNCETCAWLEILVTRPSLGCAERHCDVREHAQRRPSRRSTSSSPTPGTISAPAKPSPFTPTPRHCARARGTNNNQSRHTSRL
jgi:hypothetical protein